jgi:hypothetical protein
MRLPLRSKDAAMVVDTSAHVCSPTSIEIAGGGGRAMAAAPGTTPGVRSSS